MNVTSFFRLFLSHLFLLYAVLFSICGVHMIAIILTVSLFIALNVYKLPRSEQTAIDHVLQPEKVSVIAHRGGAYDAPENTLASFKVAKDNGADAVEFDLEFTSDGHPVILHDDDVDRTTDGKGPISRMTLEQARKLNAAARHRLKDKFVHEQIPTLEETIQMCLELELKMYMDVKGNAKKAAETLPPLFKKYPDMYKNAIVCSFYPDVAYLVKKADPDIITALTHRHKVLTRKIDGTEREGTLWKKLVYPLVDIVLEWGHYHWLWYLCGSSAFLLEVNEVNQRVVDHFAARGIKIIVWTANNNGMKDFLTNIVKCSYITDTLLVDDCGAQKN